MKQDTIGPRLGSKMFTDSFYVSPLPGLGFRWVDRPSKTQTTSFTLPLTLLTQSLLDFCRLSEKYDKWMETISDFQK